MALAILEQKKMNIKTRTNNKTIIFVVFFYDFFVRCSQIMQTVHGKIEFIAAEK